MIPPIDEITSSIGEVAPSIGEVAPSIGELMSSIGEVTPSIDEMELSGPDPTRPSRMTGIIIRHQASSAPLADFIAPGWNRCIAGLGKGAIMFKQGITLKRKLFNLAAILSMVLCLGTAGVWVSSYWSSDVIQNGYKTYKTQDDFCYWRFSIMPMRGTILFFIDRFDYDLRHPERFTSGNLSTDMAKRFREKNLPGFDGMSFFTQGPNIFVRKSILYPEIENRIGNSHGPFCEYWTLSVPSSYIFILLMILPARWLYLKRRDSKLLRTGCCRKCGYDLRATPERCPECGTVVVVESAG